MVTDLSDWERGLIAAGGKWTLPGGTVVTISCETFGPGEYEFREAGLRVLEHQEGDGPMPRCIHCGRRIELTGTGRFRYHCIRPRVPCDGAGGRP